MADNRMPLHHCQCQKLLPRDTLSRAPEQKRNNSVSNKMVRCLFCSKHFCSYTPRCMNATPMPDDFAMTCRSYLCDCTVKLRCPSMRHRSCDPKGPDYARRRMVEAGSDLAFQYYALCGPWFPQQPSRRMQSQAVVAQLVALKCD